MIRPERRLAKDPSELRGYPFEGLISKTTLFSGSARRRGRRAKATAKRTIGLIVVGIGPLNCHGGRGRRASNHARFVPAGRRQYAHSRTRNCVLRNCKS